MLLIKYVSLMFNSNLLFVSRLEVCGYNPSPFSKAHQTYYNYKIFNYFFQVLRKDLYKI